MPVGVNPVEVAVNQATHTIYVGNGGENTVSVINGTACNATHTSGCGQNRGHGDRRQQPSRRRRRPGNQHHLRGERRREHGLGDQRRHLQRREHLGLRPEPANGDGRRRSFSSLAVDPATDTIYVGSFDDNTVSVINGATCNGTDTSGCGQVPATVTVGSVPGRAGRRPGDPHRLRLERGRQPLSR